MAGPHYNSAMQIHGFPCTVIFAALVGTACGAFGQNITAPVDIAFSEGLDVSINGGTPIHFGIDTGLAWDFILTSEQARQLGLPVVGQHAIHTSDRQTVPGSNTDMIRAKTLTVGGHTFTDCAGLASPNFHHIDLGITLFRDELLTLDFPRNRLQITDGQLPPPNSRDILPYTTQPEASFRVLQVSPTVTIQLAGLTVPALLDTGAHTAPGDVIVPTGIAANLPLGPKVGTVTIGDALGRQFPSYLAQLNGDLTLGDVVVHHPMVLVSDWLGFIDLAHVSNRLVLTIDQRNHRLRVTMPDTAPSPAQ